MKYMVVIEKGVASYGTRVPDLPGCIAVGKTKEEVTSLIKTAIEFHIEGLRQSGDPIPHMRKKQPEKIRTGRQVGFAITLRSLAFSCPYSPFNSSSLAFNSYGSATKSYNSTSPVTYSTYFHCAVRTA